MVISVLLFTYRKTKVGGKIIEILKAIAVLFRRAVKAFFILIWKTIRKIIKRQN